MWRVLAILSICAIGANAACTLNFDKLNPGLFTRKFGSNRIIIPAESGIISMTDDLIIEGYCSSGFRDYSTNTPTQYYDKLIFSCNGNTVRYQIPGSSTYYSLYNYGSMKCLAESEYYEAKVDSCSYYGLQYGFYVEKDPVIIANVCYDLNSMRTKYIHYVAGTRTTVIENQVNFNPGNSSTTSLSLVNVTFDSSFIKKENTSILDAVNTQMPNYAEIVQYQLQPLIPVNTAAGILSAYTVEFDSTNMAAWWKPLKFGNWREVEKALSNIAVDGIYDVYAGTSGSVLFPFDGKCFFTERLTYKIDQFTRAAPLYIWNYVKEKNSKDEGVVIIGVNSPFYVAPPSNQTEFCENQCNRYSWLSVVDKVREMTPLGYIYCCSPKDVQKQLDGFPIL